MKESKETMMLPSDTVIHFKQQTSNSSTLLAAGSLDRQTASAGKCKGNEPNLNKSVRKDYSYTLPLSGDFFFFGGGEWGVALITRWDQYARYKPDSVSWTFML